MRSEDNSPFVSETVCDIQYVSYETRKIAYEIFRNSSFYMRARVK